MSFSKRNFKNRSLSLRGGVAPPKQYPVNWPQAFGLVYPFNGRLLRQSAARNNCVESQGWKRIFRLFGFAKAHAYAS